MFPDSTPGVVALWPKRAQPEEEEEAGHSPPEEEEEEAGHSN